MDSYYYNNTELTREESQIVEECRDTYLIGRLRDNYQTELQQSNFNIKFFIKQLCDDPKPIYDYQLFREDDDYIGFDYRQTVDMLPLYYNPQGYNVEEREEQLIQHLSNKLIIFKPEYNQSSKNGRWFKNLIITGMTNDDIDLYFSFTAIPRVVLEPAIFEQRLKKAEYFELPDFNGRIYDSPEMILCGQYIYRLDKEHKINEFLQVNTNNYRRWKCADPEHVVRINLLSFEKAKTCVKEAADGLVFVENNLYSEIMISDAFSTQEEERKPFTATSPIAKPAVDSVDEELDEMADESVARELAFLRGLKNLTMENGLQYKEKDLYNFHISVKTNPLTILSGMSGTGKSRLAMNYAKMLDLSEDNKTLLFLPITPSYTEPGDVLGYLNSMNGLFVPSETGLVQLLLHASQNPDQMHMVIFDEMNLSQVEYWFSPFISILEKDKNERFLKLYDEDAHCINNKVYPPMIKVGENIIFVGTVNIDDTTKDFSDRLLDRTFVINLGMVSFSDFYTAYANYQLQGKKEDVVKAKCKNVSEFMSWCKGDDKRYMEAFRDKESELAFFDELSALINRYIPSGGISHRVLKNIGNYILNVPQRGNDTIIDRGEVLDLVINQTVMTKIRGTETQLDKLVGSFDSDKNELINSELVDLLDKYASISEFELVKGTLKNKAEELRINGYTN